MKKILILCIAIIILIPTIFLGYRYTNNITSEIPYPFRINPNLHKDIETDAPIIIVGDMMAKRLATYTKALSQKISGDIAKPIKIQSFATDGEGLHRTLDKIKKLKQLPFVVIYLGNLDNNLEKTFNNKDMTDILENLKQYYDPLIHFLV